MSSVLIADDHAMIRTGLRHYLQADRSITRIQEAATGAATLEALAAEYYDLVILDINMPDRNGVDILRDIRARHATTRVLVVSGFAEKQYAINVLRAGAAGYLAKDQAPSEFLRAIRTVLSGKRFVSATLGDLLMDGLDESSDRPLHSSLSRREFQILCKLAIGEPVSKIAHELLISVKTVSTYRARVMEKMRLSTNADLTTYAIHNGLMQ